MCPWTGFELASPLHRGNCCPIHALNHLAIESLTAKQFLFVLKNFSSFRFFSNVISAQFCSVQIQISTKNDVWCIKNKITLILYTVVSLMKEDAGLNPLQLQDALVMRLLSPPGRQLGLWWINFLVSAKPCGASHKTHYSISTRIITWIYTFIQHIKIISVQQVRKYHYKLDSCKKFIPYGHYKFFEETYQSPFHSQ